MKLIIAVVLYLVAFATLLLMLYGFVNPTTYADWTSMLYGFGGSPLPGTDLLLLALRAWWLYPLLGAVVFYFGIVRYRKLAVSVLFMWALALLLLVYYYYPYYALGAVV